MSYMFLLGHWDKLCNHNQAAAVNLAEHRQSLPRGRSLIAEADKEERFTTYCNCLIRCPGTLRHSKAGNIW